MKSGYLGLVVVLIAIKIYIFSIGLDLHQTLAIRPTRPTVTGKSNKF